MYELGDIRTDDEDRMWCKGDKEWFIMRDENRHDQFNTVIKKFEHGVPNEVRLFYSLPSPPIGSTQIASIQRTLADMTDRLQRMEELILKFGRSK